MRWAFSVLGAVAAVGILCWLGVEKRLPWPVQDTFDSVWPGRAEKKAKVDQRGLEVAPSAPATRRLPKVCAPAAVELPDGPFVPLALLYDGGGTSLVYLRNGKPKLGSAKGIVWWDEEVGPFRLHVERAGVPLLGPDGGRVKTKKRSYVDQLRRYVYRSTEEEALFPKDVRGVELDAEDLEHKEIARAAFLREERKILALQPGAALLERSRAIFLGGAHPALEAAVERVGLRGGTVLAPRFEAIESAGAARAFADKERSKEGCIGEHAGSAAVRGPAGILLAAAVLEGRFESCRGRLRLTLDRTELEGHRSRGVPVGSGATLTRGSIWMGEVVLADGVADAVPLEGVPAVLLVLGRDFLPALPRASAKARRLQLLPLSRTGKAVSLGRVRPLIGALALPVGGVSRQDLDLLSQIFSVARR